MRFKPLSGLAAFLLFTTCILSLPACATALTHGVNLTKGFDKDDMFYSGVRADLFVADYLLSESSEDRLWIDYFWTGVVLLDTPLSLVADTVLLPLSFASYLVSESEEEEAAEAPSSPEDDGA